MYQLHQPYSGSRGFSDPPSRNNSPDSPDLFWFNPNLNQIVISKTAPSNDSILVIATLGSSTPNLRDIYEQFLFQQIDSFNSSYRNDSGTYDSKPKREQRQIYYNRQKPVAKLEEKNQNVPFQNDQNPNPSGYLGTQSSSQKRPFWMKIVTPDEFTYTTAIIANVPREGILHLLLRHGHQFHGLSKDILSILPSSTLKKLCKDIRDCSPDTGRQEKEKRNNEFMNEMMKMDEGEFKELLDLQREMRDVIQNIVKHQNYLGESINTNGQQQVYWRTDFNEVMVICLSEQLYRGQVEADSRGRMRNIKKIITIFTISKQAFERKKNNDWPVTTIFA